MTVSVYIPSWPPITARSSISRILPAIKNMIPTGAYLQQKHKASAENWHPHFHISFNPCCLDKPQQASSPEVLTEPHCWMTLPVSFPETWSQLRLVHHMIKTQHLLRVGDPSTLLCAQLGHWWRFPPPSGFPTSLQNTPCRIGRGGYG